MSTAGPAGLTGYRERVEAFHGGRWLEGEFLSFQQDRRAPRFCDVAPGDAAAPASDRTLVSEDFALVRFTDVDWTDRRARLEVRVLADGVTPQLADLLRNAVDVAVARFGLLRLEGLVTPVDYEVGPVLRTVGFEVEAVVPQAVRVGGAAVDRQVWGLVVPE